MLDNICDSVLRETFEKFLHKQIEYARDHDRIIIQDSKTIIKDFSEDQQLPL